MGPAALFGIKLGETIIDAGKALIRRKWPDPAEAAKREKEFAEIVHSIDTEQIAGLRNFILDYEGRAADVHPAMQILRGSVRPVLTYYLVGLLSWAIYAQKPLEIIQFVFTLNLLSMGFWYGERALAKLGINSETIKGVFGKNENQN